MDDAELALDIHNIATENEARQASRFLRHRRRKSAFLTEPLVEKPLPGDTAFSLHDFLSSRRHLPIDQLRQELVEMLEGVKKNRVDVISVEHAAFVGMADGLKGVDGELEDLLPTLMEVQRTTEV
jgi:hypothetical protein